MNVLVTGSKGFIGKNLISRFNELFNTEKLNIEDKKIEHDTNIINKREKKGEIRKKIRLIAIIFDDYAYFATLGRG